jgi:flavin reductase (DIM6/NTAB) family NADH-FMN oxidoreductase RutF
MDGIQAFTAAAADVCAPEPYAGAARDTRDLRNAFGAFATGVTVVTSRAANRQVAGVTVNSFCSVSLEPPLVMWCLSKSAPSHRVFVSAAHFAVHILAEDQAHLSARFSAAAPNKFAGLEISEGLGGAPVLEGVAALFECRCERQIDAGDHHIILGRVERYRYSTRRPLLFHTGAYRSVGALLAG